MSLQELHDLAAPVPEVAAAAAATSAPADSANSSAHTAAGLSSSAARAADAGSPPERSKSCPELIKEMSVEEIVQHYRLFVRELSDELVAVQQEKANSAPAAAHAAAAGSSAAAAGGGGCGVAAAAAAVEKPEDSGGFSSLSEQRLQQLTQRCQYMFRVAATLNPGGRISLCLWQLTACVSLSAGEVSATNVVHAWQRHSVNPGRLVKMFGLTLFACGSVC
jgi:hypothetical protein